MELEQVQKHFNEKAIRFIEHICLLEGKQVPDLENLNDDEILSIYSEMYANVTNKLMMHRNIPVDSEYLSRLDMIDLPKSIKIILDSFNQNNK